MSEIRKYKSQNEFLVKEFDLTNREKYELDRFIMNHKTKSTKEFFDELIYDKSLNDREKVAISYIVGKFMKDHEDIKVTALQNSILEEILFVNEEEGA